MTRNKQVYKITFPNGKIYGGMAIKVLWTRAGEFSGRLDELGH